MSPSQMVLVSWAHVPLAPAAHSWLFQCLVCVVQVTWWCGLSAQHPLCQCLWHVRWCRWWQPSHGPGQRDDVLLIC